MSLNFVIIAHFSDEYGVQILADLDDQKESLIRVRDKVRYYLLLSDARK